MSNTRFYCPKCGEYTNIKDDVLYPTAIIECDNCGNLYSIEYKILYDEDLEENDKGYVENENQ
jgi:DNA-directed RNA polymerase subunit M/transcription elongation factor TFIIS